METTNNQCKNRAILVGRHYDLPGPFGVHQVWQRLLSDCLAIGEQPALIGPAQGSFVTFEQLDKQSTELARQLLSRHQRPDNGADWIVAVCLPPSADLIVSLLAIFKLGAAYLPLDPSFPSNRVAHILSDARPALLLSSTPVLDETHFDQIQDDLTVFRYDGQVMQQGGDSAVLSSSQQELAIVLYTSGSTGTPKGVRLTHRNIYHRLFWQWHTFPYAAGEVAVFKTALTFVDSIAEIWAPLLKGVPIVVVPKIVTQDPERFIATLESHKVSRLVLVPSLLSSILAYVAEQPENQCRPLHHLRLWVCSGEVLTAKLLVQFFHLFDAVVCNFYGSTEITGDVTSVIFRNKEDVESSLLENKVPLGKLLFWQSK